MKLVYKYRYLLLGLLALGVGIYSYFYYQHQKEVIATIGDFEITKSEFITQMNYRGGNNISELNKEILLYEMIEKKLFLNKAKSIRLEDDKMIQRAYNAMLRGEIRRQFIEEKRKKIVITEGEIKRYYQSHKSEYKLPLKRKIAIVFFKKRAKDKAREQKRAEEQFAELINLYTQNLLPEPSKGFGKYAIAYSDHQVSRYRGGELGWFTKDTKTLWEKKVLDRAFTLSSVGDISEIIETSKGYYLTRLMEEKKEKYRTLLEVKSTVRYQLLMSKQKAIKENFMRILKKEFKQDIDLSKLDEIKIPKTDVIKKSSMGLFQISK